MVYYLLILDLWIKRYEFTKIGVKSDSNFYLNFCLNQGRPRGSSSLEGTGSAGSVTWDARSNEIWMI
jgi:hypothetical protein